MKRRRRALSPLFGLLATAALAAQQPSATLTELRSGARPLRVGGVSEYPPFNVAPVGAKLTGLDREIVQELARRAGIAKVEFVAMSYSQLAPALQQGRIDLIANGYWITDEGERTMAFTRPYFTKGGLGSFWLAGKGPYDSAERLAGKRIAVFKGSYGETWVKEHVPTAKLVSMDGTWKELHKLVRYGKADALVSYYHRQQAAAAEYESFKFESALLQPMKAAFAVRKDAGDLRDALDAALTAMQADGSLKKLQQVYLDPAEVDP